VGGDRKSYWQAWHDLYDTPTSYLSRRLATVQRHIRAALDQAPPGAIRAISMCAGQGRDLIGVLTDHPRGADVTARLVELDEGNAALAQASAAQAGLDRVDVVCGDASTTDAFVGAAPAALVLVCGVFGNISDGDIERTVEAMPRFCAPDATVIWTRHRRAPDLTPSIREWFGAGGFDEVAFEAPTDALFGVGVHRFSGAPQPLRPGRRLFRFVGDGHDAA
jgi:hypothetical protein